MRSQEITINEKTIIIKERRIAELKKLYDEVVGGAMGEADKLFKSDLPSDASKAIGGMITGIMADKLALIIPGLKAEDIENAYPSEVEGAIKAFIDVNFMGLKGVGAPLLKMFLSAPKQPQASSSTSTTQP